MIPFNLNSASEKGKRSKMGMYMYFRELNLLVTNSTFSSSRECPIKFVWIKISIPNR